MGTFVVLPKEPIKVIQNRKLKRGIYSLLSLKMLQVIVILSPTE